MAVVQTSFAIFIGFKLVVTQQLKQTEATHNCKPSIACILQLAIMMHSKTRAACMSVRVQTDD